MTRILLLILIAMTCAARLSAQDEMPEKKRLMISNELGVNFTNILNKIIKINQDSANENPYLLTYRLGLNRKWGIRAGVQPPTGWGHLARKPRTRPWPAEGSRAHPGR